MAIRIKNLDFESEGMKRHSMVSIGDVTATRGYVIFSAPIACKIDSIDIYATDGESAASGVAITARARLSTDSDASLQSRGTSATGVTSNTISANSRYRLIPSANNSLTQGTPITLDFSAQGSANLSAVMVHVKYTPLVHKETT